MAVRALGRRGDARIDDRRFPATQAAALAAFGTTARQCYTANELSEVVNFAVNADLGITKTSAPVTTVNAGQTITYTLNVTNNGPATASNVTVTDPLPAGESFVSASGTGWSCGQSAGTVTCTMASLAVGSANPITITATAPRTAGTLTNTATVSSSTSDTNTANNSSTATLVVASAEVALSKTGTASTVFGTFPVTYTITVTNTGPGTAGNVTVTDPLPAGATFVSAAGAGWTCNNVANVVTCTMPLLAVGTSTPITVIMTAPNVTANGTLTNTATLTSGTTDPSTTNNSSSAAAIIEPATAIPALSRSMLALLALFMAAAGAVALKRL